MQLLQPGDWHQPGCASMSYPAMRRSPPPQLCATTHYQRSSRKTSSSTVPGQETELHDADRGAAEQGKSEKAGPEVLRDRLRPILCPWLGQVLYFVCEEQWAKAWTTVSVALPQTRLDAVDGERSARRPRRFLGPGRKAVENKLCRHLGSKQGRKIMGQVAETADDVENENETRLQRSASGQ